MNNKFEIAVHTPIKSSEQISVNDTIPISSYPIYYNDESDRVVEIIRKQIYELQKENLEPKYLVIGPHEYEHLLGYLFSRKWFRNSFYDNVFGLDVVIVNVPSDGYNVHVVPKPRDAFESRLAYILRDEQRKKEGVFNG